MAELASGFDCRVCGTHHETLPLSFHIKAPLAATMIPAEQVLERVVINAEQCVIDGTKFYLRGRIVVPIRELEDEPFIWGVWVEVSPKDFVRTQSFWKIEGREATPAYRGWLDSEIPIFASTINLEVKVRTQVVGRRPHLELTSASHPLALEQRAGITLLRVQEIAEALLHP